jgi:hypothetical protein
MLCNRIRVLEVQVNELQTQLNVKLSRLPEEVCAEVLNHCVVNGAVPISSQQIATLIQNLEERIVSKVESLVTGTSNSMAVTTEHVTASPSSRLFLHSDGKYRRVPEGWRYPR